MYYVFSICNPKKNFKTFRKHFVMGFFPTFFIYTKGFPKNDE